MRRLPLYLWMVSIVLLASSALAQMPTTVKNSLIRAENPKGAKEKLIIPYAFSSETMGLTFGVGALAKGYGQDQLLVAGTVYAGSNNAVKVEKDAASVIAGMWDLRVPYTKRFFFTATGSVGYFPRKRAYSAPSFPPTQRGRGATNREATSSWKWAGLTTGPIFAWNTSCPSGRLKMRP